MQKLHRVQKKKKPGFSNFFPEEYFWNKLIFLCSKINSKPEFVFKIKNKLQEMITGAGDPAFHKAL